MSTGIGLPNTARHRQITTYSILRNKTPPSDTAEDTLEITVSSTEEHQTHQAKAYQLHSTGCLATDVINQNVCAESLT